MRHRRSTLIVAAAALSVSAGACGSDDDSSAQTTAPAAAAAPTNEEFLAVATAYADGVIASYDAAIASTKELQSTIDALLANPSEQTLEAANAQWLTALDDYGPTEAFRLYDGPIDNPVDGPEGQINAWPMDEAYVDYVDGDPDAGIINNPAE